MRFNPPTVTMDFETARLAYYAEPRVAVDLETSGLSAWNDRAHVIALYGELSNTVAILHYPKGVDIPQEHLDWLAGFDQIVWHNGTQFDALFMANHGFDWRRPQLYDTLVGEQATLEVNRKDIRVNLADSIKRRLGKVIDKNIEHGRWGNQTLDENQMAYVTGDISYILALQDKQLERTRDRGTIGCVEFEMELTKPVIAMELNGLPVDVNAIQAYFEGREVKFQEQDAYLRSVLGDILLSSFPQLTRALGEKFGPRMFPDTKAERLMTLAQGEGEQARVAEALLGWRHYRQRQNMFGPEWQAKYVVPSPTGHRVHGKFWQLGTDTGRFCVTGDTPIEMPRDMRRYPEGVPISEVHVGDLVYSFTWDRKLCIRPVKWVGVTGQREIVELTVESKWRGETRTVRLTPDHLVRTWRGEWVHAGSLRPGQKLMSMPRRRPTKDGEYVIFGANAERHGLDTKTQGKLYEHRWVYAQTHGLSRIPAHHDVHHVDEDSWNNSPENLELLTKSRHMSHHAQKRSRGERPSGWREVNESGVIQTGTGYTVVSVIPAGIEEVWDLEVEETHAFIGAGIVLHNSSTEPNLQQVPSDMKHCYGGHDGIVVGKADYAAIEVRVAAALADDPIMIAAFNGGEDIHRLVAAAGFNKRPEDVTPEERKIAKAMSFTLIFGGSVETFMDYARSNGSKIDHDLAQAASDNFFRRFTGIGQMKASAIERTGRGRPITITYPTGLRRLLNGPDLRPTVLLNNVVQGTASAGMKYALVEAYRRGLADYLSAAVHDELVYTAPVGMIGEIQGEIAECMVQGMHRALEGCPPIKIAVEATYGPTWKGDPANEFRLEA